MKRVQTRIKGLDELFNGGLQIGHNSYGSTDLTEKSIIIVIKGAKGTYKPLLALQMMHGISKSLHKLSQRPINVRVPRNYFFSINKREDNLNDMYLDLLISSQMHKMIRHFNLDCLYNLSNEKSKDDRFSIIKYLFDLDGNDLDGNKRFDIQSLNHRIGSDLVDMASSNLAYYNVRTNALHYRNGASNDSEANLIALRRYNKISDYIENVKTPESNGSKIISDFTSNIINTKFVGTEYFNDGEFSYERNPVVLFNEIKNEVYRHSIEKTQEEKEDGHPIKDNRLDVIVIDGFSQIGTEDLVRLPIPSLLKDLRKAAKVSILVFDDRSEVSCDGDVVIELKQQESEIEEYMYHVLQISKSTFQEAAIGWHQYKRRDDGIEVFPSLHRLLSKRYYLPDKRRKSSNSVFYTDFETAQSVKGCAATRDWSDKKDLILDVTEFSRYKDKMEVIETKIREELFQSYCEDVNGCSPVDFKLSLTDILLGAPHYENHCFGYKNHLDATAIIGNPNSYKRYLVMATAYSYAKQGIHTLFFLFDKNDLDIRKQIVCPACVNLKGSTAGKFYNCKNCTELIHNIDLRMGCISAEEFFAILLEQ